MIVANPAFSTECYLAAHNDLAIWTTERICQLSTQIEVITRGSTSSARLDCLVPFSRQVSESLP